MYVCMYVCMYVVYQNSAVTIGLGFPSQQQRQKPFDGNASIQEHSQVTVTMFTGLLTPVHPTLRT